MSDLKQQLETLSSLGLWEWPEDGHTIVAKGLADLDVETRLLGLECAAESFDRALVTRMIELWHGDPETVVQAAAAVSLGPALELMSDEMLDDEGDDEGPSLEDIEDALPLTLEAFKALETDLQRRFEDTAEEPEVRRRCLEAAVRSPRDWHKAGVRYAFEQEGQAWRLTAVFCAGYVPGFGGEITDALDDEAPEVRMEAIRSAGVGGIEVLGPEILDLLKDEEAYEPFRIAAAETLVHLDPPGTREVLEDLSQGEGDLAEMAALVLEDLKTFDLDTDFDDDSDDAWDGDEDDDPEDED